MDSGYTTHDVAGWLGLSIEDVRSCARAGLVRPERGTRGELRLSFQDVALLRRAAHLVSTGLLILYWLTPVIYPPSVLPERFREIFAWNPLSGVLTGVRGVLLHGEVPSASDWMHLLVPTAIVLLSSASWSESRPASRVSRIRSAAARSSALITTSSRRGTARPSDRHCRSSSSIGTPERSATSTVV